LAAELRSEFPDAEIKFIESSGGVFDVKVDGELLFSKKRAGRHAARGEVMALIKERMVP